MLLSLLNSGKNSRIGLAVVLTVGALLSPLAAHAQTTYTWYGNNPSDTGNQWNQAGHWLVGGATATSDPNVSTAIVDFDGTDPYSTQANLAFNSFTIGTLNFSGAVAQTIENGSNNSSEILTLTTLNDSSSANTNILGTVGTASVTSLKGGSTTLAIGNAGTGTLNISAAINAAGILNVSNSSSGSVSLTGAITNTNAVTFSNTGTGTITTGAISANGGYPITFTGTGNITVNGAISNVNGTPALTDSNKGIVTLNGARSFGTGTSSNLAVASGATLVAGVNNAYGNTNTATALTAGTLQLGASSLTQSLGALTLGAGISAIDFGASNTGGTLSFTSGGTFSGTLDVLNYVSGDTLTIGTNAGLTSAQLADIFFINPNGTSGTYAATQDSSGNVAFVSSSAAPEPGSLAGMVFGASLGCVLLRRRLLTAG